MPRFRRAAAAVVAVVVALLVVATPVGAQSTPGPSPNPSPILSIGFDPRNPPANTQPVVYEYDSADYLWNLPAPPDPTSPEFRKFQQYLDDLEDRDYTRGSLAHFWQHWRNYVASHPGANFDRYRRAYISAVNNKSIGDAFEALLRQLLGLDRSVWMLNQKIPEADSNRRVDGYNPNDPTSPILEFKSGPSLRPDQLRDLMKIAQSLERPVVYIFGARPKPATLNKLDAAGKDANVSVTARYLPTLPQPRPIGEDPKAPAAPDSARPRPTVPTATPDPAGSSAPGGVPPSGPGGPSSSPGGGAAAGPGVLAAPGQVPVAGPLADALARSPDSPEDAAVATEVIEALAAEFDDEDTLGDEPLGGVDFATLELRYVSDTYRGAGAQFSFRVEADSSIEVSYGGRRAAQLASDAFFVWLALPPSAFTVNLNPDEPDRIIDDRFGRTDAGRVLLEADLQMKKTTGELIHPETPLGRQFWNALQGDKCLSLRQWIVPAPATVYETENELFILDAPLDVKMETDYIQTAGVAGSCDDRTFEAHNENVYRQLILPEVVKAVNEAPEYADLRRVYASRVAAEWFRERAATKRTAYSDIIDSGDISRWVSREPWSPREVFDRYVRSYTEGEFTYEWVEGDYVYAWVYGGVDFTRIDESDVGAEEFARTRPTLAQSVLDSLFTAAVEQDGQELWLGGLTTTRPIKELPAFNPPKPPTSSMAFYLVVGAPVLAWLMAGAWLIGRRRRRPSTTGAVRP